MIQCSENENSNRKFLFLILIKNHKSKKENDTLMKKKYNRKSQSKPFHLNANSFTLKEKRIFKNHLINYSTQ